MNFQVFSQTLDLSRAFLYRVETRKDSWYTDSSGLETLEFWVF